MDEKTQADEILNFTFGQIKALLKLYDFKKGTANELAKTLGFNNYSDGRIYFWKKWLMEQKVIRETIVVVDEGFRQRAIRMYKADHENIDRILCQKWLTKKLYRRLFYEKAPLMWPKK